jgi:RNA 2',3'-cyclic 3'-phosphodiesterase
MPDRREEARLKREDTTGKTHLTAVVLIPPEEIWEPIQRVRRLHDAGVRRWMPHITLLYPFVPHERLDQAAIACAEAVARLPVPEIRLSRFGFFNHPSGRVTLWLDPQPSQRIVALHEALQPVFPHCDEMTRHEGGFIPHLTLGSFHARAAARVTRDQLEASWYPLPATLSRMAIIARSGYEKDPFRVVTEIPIGSKVI